ncbi:uncharacterized protein [Periplaneta americana]|uniref:uncharacterized protein n=1 Tax=Periplaneta americana TaxID=6978 RepID=UPI0037E8E753
MVRTYKRKTNRGCIDEEIYERAAKDVSERNLSIRQAAEAHAVNFMTLHRYLKRKREQDEDRSSRKNLVGYVRHRQTFSDELEKRLEDYIIHCSRIYYGLSSKDVRTLAYEYAVACNIKFPEKWAETKMATEDWVLSFLKRHPKLSLRTPEATSLARATSFNAHNVGLFYNNLDQLFQRHQFEGHQIWNLDETGVTTVQKPPKVIAEKGKKQVGRATSAEKGATVTMEVAVNAIGNSVPPLFIFPRVHFKPHFILQGPPGCIGAAHPSGWITGPIFLEYVKHFHKHVPSSVEKPVLLLLDNHISHLSISVLDYCKENGIILLSFPPHTSHRLQPLDLSVYGPFKKYYYTACCDWMNSHPGSPISIYDIPAMAKEALANSLTPKNIMAGFQKAGIWPFNRNVYGEQDFVTATVTDRPLPESDSVTSCENESVLPQDYNQPTVSGMQTVGTPTRNVADYGQKSVLSPEDVRPYPKAAPRKISHTGRKKTKSAILTDTPVKEALRKEEEARNERKNKKAANVKKRILTDSNESLKKIKKRRNYETELSSETEDDEDCICVVCLKPYSKSKRGDDWIQCTMCKKWAHERCGGDDPYYVCIHCTSDLSAHSDSED